MYKIVIILVIIFTVIFVILSSLFILYYPFSSATTTRIENHASVIAVIISIAIFIIERLVERYQTLKENEERICNTCSALLTEIRIQKSTLTNPMYADQYVIRDNDIKYISRIINTAAYDSIVNSGLFTNFKPETQNILSNLYLRIKYRNEFLTHLNSIGDVLISTGITTEVDLFIEREKYYQRIITIVENEIISLLRLAESHIKKELS